MITTQEIILMANVKSPLQCEKKALFSLIKLFANENK